MSLSQLQFKICVLSSVSFSPNWVGWITIILWSLVFWLSQSVSDMMELEIRVGIPEDIYTYIIGSTISGNSQERTYSGWISFGRNAFGEILLF